MSCSNLYHYSICWVYLVIELLFQLFLRPDDYNQLLKGSDAYSPRTVHYINRFHLFFESLALIFAMWDFFSIFGVKPRIDSIKACVYATVGESLGLYILGYLYFFITRFRLFCLIRHKRNHWLNALYMNNKDAKRTNFDVASTLADATSNPKRLLKREKSHQSRKLQSLKSLVSNMYTTPCKLRSYDSTIDPNLSLCSHEVPQRSKINKKRMICYQRLQKSEQLFFL